MKNVKVIVLIAAFGLAITSFGQDANTLARVEVIDGKEVYLLNEPIRDYEVIGTVRTGLKLTSILTRGIVNEDINDKAAQFTRKSIRKLERKNDESFDAILYTKGKKVQAIRFTEKATEENEKMARIQSYFGLHAFIMAEPVANYTVTKDINYIVRGIPLLTYGWINNSIERDVISFAKKANRKADNPEYIAYQTGRKASVISFK